MTVRGSNAGQVSSGVDGDSQGIEVLTADLASFKLGGDFVDVNSGDEYVITDRWKHTVSNKEHCWLYPQIHRQYRFDDRLEQVLVVDYRDDSEEYDQQRGEGEWLFECFADLVFFGDAVKAGNQNDNGQADQAHFCQVKSQCQDQEGRYCKLNIEGQLVAFSTLGILGHIELLQDAEDVVRDQRTVTEQLVTLGHNHCQ